jgi:hypothetical protein
MHTTLQFKTENGSGETIRSRDKIKKIILYEPTLTTVIEQNEAGEWTICLKELKDDPTTTLKSEETDWTGFWITEKQKFVEVVSNNEVYLVNQQGERTIQLYLNEDGECSFYGKLLTKRRGEETLARFGLDWPKLKGC